MIVVYRFLRSRSHCSLVSFIGVLFFLVVFAYLSIIKNQQSQSRPISEDRPADSSQSLAQQLKRNCADAMWDDSYLARATRRYNLMMDSALREWRYKVDTGAVECTTGRPTL